MTIFAVEYTYTDDSAARDEHRPAHRAYLGQLADEGTLLVSGPYLGRQPDGALLVVAADSAERVAALLRQDPFQQQGLVADCRITEWNPVIGRWAQDV